MAKHKNKSKSKSRKQRYIAKSSSTSSAPTTDAGQLAASDKLPNMLDKKNLPASNSANQAEANGRTRTDQTSVVVDSEVGLRVRRELRHSISLIGSIVVGMVILWLVFEHTGLGRSVYQLIKL